MLDLVAVLTTGGIILWEHSSYPQPYRDVIEKVMYAALIDTTAAGNTMLVGALEVRWTVQHELGLVFLVAYQRILPLTYVPPLLEQLKFYWTKHYAERLREEPFRPIDDFDEPFASLARKVEERDREERKSKTRPSEPTKSGNSGKKESSAATTTTARKKGKQMRDWGDKVTKESLESLDLSTDKEEATGGLTAATIPQSLPSPSQNDRHQLEELEADSDVDIIPEQEEENPSGIWRYFGNLTGQKDLTRADLEVAQTRMRDHLVQKNVAAKVAKVICDSVTDSLVGRRTGTFRTLSQMVRDATETVVARILLPPAGMDLLDEIARVRTSANPRPYVMAFVGVNGVGKSTNLAKVCFWLLQNRLRVILVAGDTFRSGAVEQLRAHVRNLSVGRDPSQLQLFERGYGKDAAAIAKEAIHHAKNSGIDVVMIDTAGRMQDNAPLMAALAKLVYTNHPDKLIFVGEALVGNEAVDQLEKFNGAFCDHAPSSDKPACINGILLTKFDTIDDKVGAAISMTFIAAAPILFVGIGQTYTDLRKPNVRSIVSTLLK